MTISKQEVENAALLARLRIDDEEIEEYARQLSLVLAYVDKLNQLDTSQIEPLVDILAVSNIWRADECKPYDRRLDLFKNSAYVKDEQYVVPKIM